MRARSYAIKYMLDKIVSLGDFRIECVRFHLAIYNICMLTVTV